MNDGTGLTIEKLRAIKAALDRVDSNRNWIQRRRAHQLAVSRKSLDILFGRRRHQLEPARKMPRHWQFHVKVPRFWLDRMRPVRTNKV